MTRRIVECEDCGYKGLIHTDRDDCKKCGGKLETLASEVKKQQ